MSRFDPSHPEHYKFEIKETAVSENKTKKKSKRKFQETTNNVPSVSEKKFYKVTEDIKDVLQAKEAFSLLDMFNERRTTGNISFPFIFAHSDEILDVEEVQEIPEPPTQPIKRRKLDKENPFVYDSSGEESGLETPNDKDQTEQNSYVDLGPSKLWSEPFFFRDPDHRLQGKHIDVLNIFCIC